METALRVLVPVANGTEDIEIVTLVDVLRRARMDVTVASIEHDLTVTCARGCKLTADQSFADVRKDTFSLIALPGGNAGAAALGKNRALIEMLKQQRAARRWYAAICAAPALVLAPQGLLEGKRATCYPSFKDQLPRYLDEAVVVDGHCITSQSPATAMAFALKLVELLCGKEKRQELSEDLLVPVPA
ncbi:MAG: DJ-1/PfpI family protein [Nevskiales bacterium]|nr:DJ-1/PfpI family protein [Nevskiales bacterium]